MAPESAIGGHSSRVCEVCGRGFSKPEHLQRHARAHTKERPFKCHWCWKSFARSDVRKRHERSHTTEDSSAGLVSNGQSAAPLMGTTSSSSLEPPQQQNSSESQHAGALLDAAMTGSTSEWLDPLEPSISLDDFDFGSLDTFLNDVMIDWVQGTNNSQYYYEGLVPPTTQHSRSRTPNTDIDGAASQAQCVVDQQYSNDISRQLKPLQPQYDTTYSAEYLNLCLQMYFAHFHPIFPVVHKATFRPRSWNTLLLISMCSIGSLFIGSPESTAQGHQLYARLNKAILASWETHVSEPKPSTVPIAQAALLGQTFGLLSGKSADRFMTEVFQGTLLAWGRKLNAFNSNDDNLISAELNGPALSKAWKSWAKAEERRRLGLALYIHDTETAGLFQRDPLLRHQRIAYALCGGEDIFEASTPEDWRKLYVNQDRGTGNNETIRVGEWVKMGINARDQDPLSSSIRRSSFVAYATLANIGACVMELSSSGLNQINAQGLGKWHKIYLSSLNPRTADTQCLRVLYHQYSLVVYADLERLEKALRQQSDIGDVQSWATSSMAPCAMLHACLLQKHASEIQLGTVPPIHLPRAIFCAGVLFIAFNRFLTQSVGRSHLKEWKTAILDMANATNIALDEGQHTEQLASWMCDMLNSRLSTLPYACINLLRKLGQWGISEAFTDTLQELLDHSTDPLNGVAAGL